MCGPWAIPLALVAAGSVTKYFGEKKATKAQTGAYSAEQKRQNDLTGQQQGAFEDSLAKVRALADPAAISKAAGARESALVAAMAPQQTAGSYLPGSSSAAPVVAEAADKAARDSTATSTNLARTIAAIGGTGDAMQGTNIGVGRNSQRIGQLASFKQGSGNVLEAEMRAAARKGSFLRGVGSLAQQIGMSWMGANAAGAAGGAPLEAGNDGLGLIY